jgi:hypothetical protein
LDRGVFDSNLYIEFRVQMQLVDRRAVTHSSILDLLLLSECDYFIGTLSRYSTDLPPIPHIPPTPHPNPEASNPKPGPSIAEPPIPKLDPGSASLAQPPNKFLIVTAFVTLAIPISARVLHDPSYPHMFWPGILT